MSEYFQQIMEIFAPKTMEIFAPKTTNLLNHSRKFKILIFRPNKFKIN